jgi:hypothetical protein
MAAMVLAGVGVLFLVLSGGDSDAPTSTSAIETTSAPTATTAPVASSRTPSCIVTLPASTHFVPPNGPPPPASSFWFGHDKLWTALPLNGAWESLPSGMEGYEQKIFWWPAGPVGVTFPAAGCWEITGELHGETLRFVVWVGGKPTPIEPDANYPMPETCTTDLMPALLNRLFAAWNAGDAQAMYALFQGSGGPIWFDLGRDPLTFAADLSTTKSVELRTEADFEELVARYQGTHFTFDAQPAGTFGYDNNGNERTTGDTVSIASLQVRMTGPAVTSLGHTAVVGITAKMDGTCATDTLAGVLGTGGVE